MLALHSGAPGTGHIEAVIVAIAIFTANFRRDVLKILLMVALLAINKPAGHRCGGQHRCSTGHN
jgi:hypothetical protein